jgi:hypothetical protein
VFAVGNAFRAALSRGVPKEPKVVSNLVSNALESHAQVFPTLTEAQINRVASAVGEGSIAIHLVHRASAEY